VAGFIALAKLSMLEWCEKAVATENRSMYEVKQERGKLNPNTPAELS